MWHLVWAKSGAEILFGLKPGVNKQEFLRALSDNSVENLLPHIPVQTGDTYFVPAGTQHAMGAGLVGLRNPGIFGPHLSRLRFWPRGTSSGKPRELHIEKALEVTDFSRRRGGKIEPLALHSPDAQKYLLAACDFFATVAMGLQPDHTH